MTFQGTIVFYTCKGYFDDYWVVKENTLSDIYVCIYVYTYIFIMCIYVYERVFVQMSPGAHGSPERVLDSL